MKYFIYISFIILFGCSKYLIVNNNYPDKIIVHDIEFYGDTVMIIQYNELWNPNNKTILWMKYKKYYKMDIQKNDTLRLDNKIDNIIKITK